MLRIQNLPSNEMRYIMGKAAINSMPVEAIHRETEDWAQELTLPCVRADFGSCEKTSAELGKIPRNKIDWQDALESLHWHGLSLILYRFLIETNSVNKIPDTVFQSLRSTYIGAIAQKIFEDEILRKVLVSFAHAKIPLMIPKGIYLDRNIYYCKNIRLSIDIDLFTKKEFMVKAGICY